MDEEKDKAERLYYQHLLGQDVHDDSDDSSNDDGSSESLQFKYEIDYKSKYVYNQSQYLRQSKSYLPILSQVQYASISQNSYSQRQKQQAV